MEQNKKIAVRYKKIQIDRNATLRSNLTLLAQSGYVIVKDEKDIEFLVSALALIVRFWISEAAVSFRHLSSEQQINHYLVLIARLLTPYLSANGKKQLLNIF